MQFELDRCSFRGLFARKEEFRIFDSVINKKRVLKAFRETELDWLILDVVSVFSWKEASRDSFCIANIDQSDLNFMSIVDHKEIIVDLFATKWGGKYLSPSYKVRAGWWVYGPTK